MPSRRDYLRLVTAGTTAALAGCTLGRSRRYAFREVNQDAWQDYSAGGAENESSGGGRFRLAPGEWTWRGLGANSENEATLSYEVDLTTGPGIEIVVLREDNLPRFRNRESTNYKHSEIIKKKQSRSIEMPPGDFTGVLEYTQFGDWGIGYVEAEGRFSWKLQEY